VTRNQFEKILSEYGLSFRSGDIDVIWAAIGIKTGTMNYPDFIRLISLDSIDPAAVIAQGLVAPRDRVNENESNQIFQNEPVKRVQSCGLMPLLSRHFRQITNDLAGLDRQLTGFVSTYDFELMVQAIDLVDSDDIARFVSSYDQRNTGSFNYFTMLSDLCNQRANGCGEEVAPVAQRPRQSYGSVPEKAQVFLAEPVVMPSVSGADEILRTIATRMTEVFDSSSRCFNKWRGHGTCVGAQEFSVGAARDFKLTVSPAEAREIISRFSANGALSLGTFLRMVGAGSDSASAQTKAKSSADMGEDEKTLLHLARQARGKDWESVFERVRDPDQIVPGLRKMSIYILAPELKACFTKFGKDGVIDRIHRFIATL
jgi:hypothetical protein